MTKQHRPTLRSFYPLASLLLLHVALGFAQKGAFMDQGGAVFNVKAYGATGGGTADDYRNSAAIDAANKTGGGSSAPAGVYSLNGTLQHNQSDMVSLVGTGDGQPPHHQSKLGIRLNSTDPHIAEVRIPDGQFRISTSVVPTGQATPPFA